MSEIFAVTERQVSEIRQVPEKCQVPEKVQVSKYCLVSGKCHQILSIFILGFIACTICFLVLGLPCFFDGCTNDLVEAGDLENHASSTISGKIFFSKSHNRTLIIKEWRVEVFREQQFFIMGTSKMPYNYRSMFYLYLSELCIYFLNVFKSCLYFLAWQFMNFLDRMLFSLIHMRIYFMIFVI